MKEYKMVKIDSRLVRKIDSFVRRTTQFPTRSAFIHYYLTEAIAHQYSAMINELKNKLKKLKSKYDLNILLYPQFTESDIDEFAKVVRRAIKQYNSGPEKEEYGQWHFQPSHSKEPKAAVTPKYNSEKDTDYVNIKIEIIG